MAEIRVHLWVSGRVQGVYYRYAVEEEALNRRVTGWVLNLPDGRVEGIFEGEEARVRELLAFCRRGPPHARVEQVLDPLNVFRVICRNHESLKTLHQVNKNYIIVRHQPPYVRDIEFTALGIQEMTPGDVGLMASQATKPAKLPTKPAENRNSG
jgi:acylphosphatase